MKKTARKQGYRRSLWIKQPPWIDEDALPTAEICENSLRSLSLSSGARGHADLTVVWFYSCISRQHKEWGDANGELFKEPYDAVMPWNVYKIRFCGWISVSPQLSSKPSAIWRNGNPCFRILYCTFSTRRRGEGEKFLQESMIISMKWPLLIFQSVRAKAHGLFLCCVVPFQRVPEGFLYFPLHLFILPEESKM